MAEMEKIKNIACPKCKKIFNITPQMAGKRYRCKICSGIVAVPQDFFYDQNQVLDEIKDTSAPNPPPYNIPKANNTSRTISLRTAIGVISLIGVCILGYIALGPFITMYQIKSGIIKGDSEGLNENIDFPSLRENLKSQLNVHMMKKMTSELKDNPFAALGMGLASKFADGMVDSFVSPAGLSALLEGDRPNINTSGSNGKGEISFTEFLKFFDYSFDSIKKFSIWMKSEKRSKFVLSRQGFSWKLTNVIIPLSEIDSESYADSNKRHFQSSRTNEGPGLINIPETEVHSLTVKQISNILETDENRIIQMGKFISLLNQPHGDVKVGAVGPNEKMKAIMKSEGHYLVTNTNGERGWVKAAWLHENP